MSSSYSSTGTVSPTHSCFRTSTAMAGSWDSFFSCLHGLDSLSACRDTQEFLEVLGSLATRVPPRSSNPEDDIAEVSVARRMFRWEQQIVVTRAPGRMDVMGGIADYSGSLVLQMPLAEACHVAAQLFVGEPRSCSEPGITVVSFSSSGSDRDTVFEVAMSALMDEDGHPLEYDKAQELFRRAPSQSWAAYVVGCLLVLMKEKGVTPVVAGSLSLLVQSAVPEGKGVSSSAAVEVATMTALCQLYGVKTDDERELALLCQTVENRVVGAPCGIMDQMTSALGKSSHLLCLLCQPAQVQGFLQVPQHLAIWGLDSGIRHFVSGADYSSVRAGAFMGRKIASVAQQQSSDAVQGPSGDSGKTLGNGYLANVTPSEFTLVHSPRIPLEMQGEDFISQYGSHDDPVTSVQPDWLYQVKHPTEHPVQEHFRVQTFWQVMAAPWSRMQTQILGELMAQSHASYSQLSLGSDGTDLLCWLVAKQRGKAVATGKEPPLYGAKITGGGSGGTVCVLGSSDPNGESAVRMIQEEYCQLTGHRPVCFRGSSMGASTFGHLTVKLRSTRV